MSTNAAPTPEDHSVEAAGAAPWAGDRAQPQGPPAGPADGDRGVTPRPDLAPLRAKAEGSSRGTSSATDHAEPTEFTRPL